jgi:hypothetical protein
MVSKVRLWPTKGNVRYRRRRRQGQAMADSSVALAMSSLMTESVIDHAGPVSDHPNPVIPLMANAVSADADP